MSFSATREGRSPTRTPTRRGLFAEADQGTLFPRRDRELPLALQVKLLRVSAGRAHPAARVRPGTTRWTCASSPRPCVTSRREVEENRFRDDLYYRLNVLQLNVPPLRDRRDDILLLVEHFIERNNGRLGTQIRELDPHARKLLLNYRGRANVRELENTVERAVVLAEGDVITVADLPSACARPPIRSPPASRPGSSPSRKPPDSWRKP